MTREPSSGYARWYNTNVLKVVECPTCGSPLEIIATGAYSSGRDIISPCQPCVLDWRAKHHARAETQKKICDECGGKLRRLKSGRLKCMKKKCGMEYL